MTMAIGESTDAPSLLRMERPQWIRLAHDPALQRRRQFRCAPTYLVVFPVAWLATRLLHCFCTLHPTAVPVRSLRELAVSEHPARLAGSFHRPAHRRSVHLRRHRGCGPDTHELDSRKTAPAHGGDNGRRAGR